MNNMNFLVAAYSVVWIVLAIYLISIRTREKKLQDEILRLKHLLEK
jgi:CcmD family protein